jgi:LPS O-antigen subunit length determinant protein (WzzB/FepE family)
MQSNSSGSGIDDRKIVTGRNRETSGSVLDAAQVLALLWHRKLLLLVVLLFFLAFGGAYLLMATPVYRAEAVLIAAESNPPPNLQGTLGGLANLAGVNLGQSADAVEAVATLRSRALVESFIIDRSLLPVLFADEWDSNNQRWIGEDPNEWPDLRRGVTKFVEQIRYVEEDSVSGLVTLAVEWTDPDLAAEWVDDLVLRINSHLRQRDAADSERRLENLANRLTGENLLELRQAISSLIETELQTSMLAEVDIEYAFKVIDPVRAPEEPISPRASIVMLLSLLSGLVVGFLFVLGRHIVVDYSPSRTGFGA